jgi:hypothetical protein
MSPNIFEKIVHRLYQTEAMRMSEYAPDAYMFGHCRDNQ